MCGSVCVCVCVCVCEGGWGWHQPSANERELDQFGLH